MRACALTIDVEDYFQVSNFDDVIDRRSWESLPSRVEFSTKRLLDRIEAHSARATFFVLGWVAERHPQLVRQIHERGHEVACHGHGHELVYELGESRFREDLRRARAAIEDACGERVSGYRAPSYSITERSGWAPQVLAEEGFTYDSSIFPVRHPRYGVPGFAPHPVRLRLEGGATLREFPPTTAAIGPMRLPIAGGAYLRFLPGPLFRALFRREVGAGRPVLLYLHPWEIDPEQPRQRVSRRVALNHYANLGRTEGRLERLLEEHPFDRMDRVLDALDEAGRLPVVDWPSSLRPVATSDGGVAGAAASPSTASSARTASTGVGHG